MATHEAAADAIVPAGPASPLTGTGSFFFTGVGASTRLWEREPDAMARALRRHDELIEVGVSNHAGTLVRPRGEGDSRFAMFSQAKQRRDCRCGDSARARS